MRLRPKSHAAKKNVVPVDPVAMIAVAVPVAMTVLQHAVPAVLQVPMRLLQTVATSLLKPQVQLHRNLPFSASVK
jgi:hypothetical protein